MSQFPQLRKVLAFVLAMTTMLGFAVIAVKMSQHQPVAEPEKTITGGSSKLPPVAEQQITFEAALAQIKEEDLKKDLYYLAGKELEGRMSGKKGNELAASYVEGLYKSFGLQTTRQQFVVGRFNPGPNNEVGDDKSENILAWIEGTDPTLRNEVVVVGAHLDHIGYGPKASQAPNRREIHPGADDNASGTVALIRIAKSFSLLKEKVKRTTVFMSFSGEEMGLVGSKYYCEHPLFPKHSPSISSHVAMINMDMIGRLRRGEMPAGFDHEASSPDLGNLINELNGKYSFAKSISGRGSGGSDHAPFYNKRVPVVCLHTGMHKQYHTPDDSPDTINYTGLEQITRYAFELSWHCATDPSRPKFNYGGYKRMSEEHDHGNPQVPFPERNKK